VTVQVAQDDQFTFIAGLNTEAGYFTFPKNTWKDGDNITPDVSGRISKRNALDLEDGFVLSTRDITTIDKESWAFTSDKWLSVGGNGDLNFIVAQAGRYITFYVDTPTVTSSTLKAFSIDLNSYTIAGSGSVVGTAPIKCVSANGRLIITCKGSNPLVVTYDATLDTISVTAVNVQIRDFAGVSDGLAVSERPATLSDTHRYNLQNQGWPYDKITTYQAAIGVYPSNAQSWIYGKDSSDNFDSTILDKQDFGTSPSPKGRYILDAFNEDRATASGIAGLALVTEYNRPSVCAFFAGRAWYAGIESSRLGANVYFSQVALSTDNYGKCYQDADPTSEVLSDLLDNDGGVITIQDCGEIVDILSNDNGILVLATNGVWAIVGTSQNGFTATGYEVKKVSSYGCVSRGSVVEIDDGLLFWSYSAICKIGTDQVGKMVVQSLTDTNIKTLYTSITSLGKRYATGAYNSSDGTVCWLYNRTLTTSSAVFPYQKTNALMLDVRIGAFYKQSFSSLTTLPTVVDLVVTKENLDQDTTYNVVDDNGDTVVDDLGNIVTATILSTYAGERQYKFFTVVPDSTVFEVSFADFLNDRDAPTRFYDWWNYDSVGASFDAYLLTGYSFAPNGPSKSKQATYIITFLERTETGFDVDSNPLNESSCTLQARWDFTDNANPGKWTPGEEVYRHRRMFIPSSTDFDDGYPVVVAKSKIRGRGKALQLKYTADVDKDMVIMGWSVPMYGGTNV
jgi:hypothetical protein